MERRVVGIVSLAIGVIFLLLTFSPSATVSKPLDFDWIDYIAIALLLTWVISSVLVKLGMVFNQKESLINRASLGLFICTLISMFLTIDTISIDSGTLTRIFNSMFLIGWPLVDYFDLKYLSPISEAYLFKPLGE